MNRTTISKAVRAALAFVLGDKRGNDFVNTAGATRPGEIAPAPSAETVKRILEKYHGTAGSAPILQTEKDGRLYAIALIEQMEETIGSEEGEHGFSSWSARSEGADGSEAGAAAGEILIFRKGPQYGALLAAHDDLRQYATREAVQGFYVVFTDFVGSAISGTVPEAAYYAEQEKAREFDRWGTVNYRDAAKAAAALVKGEGAYRCGPEVKQRKQTKAEAKAADILSGAFLQVYALDDMARRLEKSPLSYHTTRSAIYGIGGQLNADLCKAFALLPPKHPAHERAKGMDAALDAMNNLMANADDGNGEFTPAKSVLGANLLAIVQTIGRLMEQAELDCGSPVPTAGYLDGDFDPAAEVKR